MSGRLQIRRKRNSVFFKRFYSQIVAFCKKISPLALLVVSQCLFSWHTPKTKPQTLPKKFIWMFIVLALVFCVFVHSSRCSTRIWSLRCNILKLKISLFSKWPFLGKFRNFEILVKKWWKLLQMARYVICSYTQLFALSFPLKFQKKRFFSKIFEKFEFFWIFRKNFFLGG